MNFLYALFTVYGISLLLTQGTIFNGAKEWLKELKIENELLGLIRDRGLELVGCLMCCSFWVGAVVNMYFQVIPWWNFIMAGGMYVGTTWILNAIVGFLGGGYDPGRTVNVIMRKSEEEE